MDDITIAIRSGDEWKSGWEAEGKFLAGLDTDNRWSLGKWLDEGFEQFGEWVQDPVPGHSYGISFYAYASSITNLEQGHLKDLRSTYVRWKEFQSLRNDEKLSWSHHRAIINGLGEENATEENIKKWVDDAVENDWNVEDLKKEMKKRKGPGGGNAETHTFQVEVPKRTWETLERLGMTSDGPAFEAARILTEHCDDQDVQRGAEVAEKLARDEAHAKRSETARRYALRNDPLGLQRER